MGYYDDPSQFAEQHGYSTERRRLYQQPVYTRSQKEAQINAQVWSTIRQGAGKGVINTPVNTVNGITSIINGVFKPMGVDIPYISNTIEYNTPIEQEVGNWTSDKISRGAGMVMGLQGASSSPVIRYRADRFSTASPVQSAVPRNLQEQVFANSVRANPLKGKTLEGMNNDSRFPTSAGFQKMEATMTLKTGEKISIHYQYNRINGRVYDLKFTNKPFDMENPSQLIENLKNGRLR